MEEGNAYCASGEDDYGVVDEGLVPEGDGERFAEYFLVEWAVGILGIIDGRGEESTKEDPEEGLNDQETASTDEVVL